MSFFLFLLFITIPGTSKPQKPKIITTAFPDRGGVPPTRHRAHKPRPDYRQGPRHTAGIIIISHCRPRNNTSDRLRLGLRFGHSGEKAAVDRPRHREAPPRSRPGHAGAAHGRDARGPHGLGARAQVLQAERRGLAGQDKGPGPEGAGDEYVGHGQHGVKGCVDRQTDNPDKFKYIYIYNYVKILKINSKIVRICRRGGLTN